MKSYILLIACLIIPIIASAQELSEDYKVERKQVYRDLNAAYKECLKKETEYASNLAIQDCKKSGEGKVVGGGCKHVAGHKLNYYLKNIDFDCERLKPTKESYKLELEKRISIKGISKYKKKGVKYHIDTFNIE